MDMPPRRCSTYAWSFEFQEGGPLKFIMTENYRGKSVELEFQRLTEISAEYIGDDEITEIASEFDVPRSRIYFDSVVIQTQRE